MGQLCCFPFSRAEEKINLFQSNPRAARTSVKRGAAPDDEELQRLSRRLVEDAVLRAVQQYRDETQHNGGGPAGQNGGGPTEPGTARPGENLNANAGTAMTTPDPNAS